VTIPTSLDPHLVYVSDDVVPRTPEGCEECLQTGSPWVHLRLCLTCGHVGAATPRPTGTPASTPG
jgi:hypothetical protein